jgi:hypothetical protein
LKDKFYMKYNKFNKITVIDFKNKMHHLNIRAGPATPSGKRTHILMHIFVNWAFWPVVSTLLMCCNAGLIFYVQIW